MTTVQPEEGSGREILASARWRPGSQEPDISPVEQNPVSRIVRALSATCSPSPVRKNHDGEARMATARGESEPCPLGYLWPADRVRTGWISDGLGSADMSEQYRQKARTRWILNKLHPPTTPSRRAPTSASLRPSPRSSPTKCSGHCTAGGVLQYLVMLHVACPCYPRSRSSSGSVAERCTRIRSPETRVHNEWSGRLSHPGLLKSISRQKIRLHASSVGLPGARACENGADREKVTARHTTPCLHGAGASAPSVSRRVIGAA